MHEQVKMLSVFRNRNRCTKNRLRYASTIVFFLLSGFTAAVGQEFANPDSIVIRTLVFELSSDKTVYSYSESIHVRFIVKNSGIGVTLDSDRLCEGVRAQETWCPPPGSTLDCFTVHEGLSSCRFLGFKTPIFVKPGLTVINDVVLRAFHTLTIPEDWTFQKASFEYDSPWEPPIFVIRASYHREGPTAVEAATWSNIKRLFR